MTKMKMNVERCKCGHALAFHDTNGGQCLWSPNLSGDNCRCRKFKFKFKFKYVVNPIGTESVDIAPDDPLYYTKA